MKQLILILITALTLPLLGQSQNLEIQNNNKVRSFKVGQFIRLGVADLDCTTCKNIFYSGKLSKVSKDSVYLDITELIRTIEKGIRKRETYRKKGASYIKAFGKEKITSVAKEAIRKSKSKMFLASAVLGAATLSTLIDREIITESESRKKLGRIVIIEAGVTAIAVTATFFLKDKVFMVGEITDEWSIK